MCPELLHLSRLVVGLQVFKCIVILSLYIYIYIYIYNNYVSVQSGMYLAPIRLLHEVICLAPITVFGYSFLANDVMESGSCAKRMALTRNFGLI